MDRIAGAYGEDVLERRLTYAGCRRRKNGFRLPEDFVGALRFDLHRRFDEYYNSLQYEEDCRRVRRRRAGT